jgi:hypothetical protein
MSVLAAVVVILIFTAAIIIATTIMNHAGIRTIRYARPLGTCIEFRNAVPPTAIANAATSNKTKICVLSCFKRKSVINVTSGSQTGAKRQAKKTNSDVSIYCRRKG